MDSILDKSISVRRSGEGNYSIRFDKGSGCWIWAYGCLNSYKTFGPTFVSQKVADRAIDEVLIPLLEKEGMDAADLFEWKI